MGVPDPAVEALVDTLARVVPAWLERCVVVTAERRLGACPAPLRAEARRMAGRVAPEVVDEIARLVRSDVDDQRATPLTILRDAVRYPTEVLAAAGVEPATRDEFSERHFPADRYDLSPSGWADVDPELHERGIHWGAAKAAIVLQRRRPRPPGRTMGS